MFNSIIESTATTSNMTIKQAMICTAASLLLGVIISCFYMIKTKHSKSYIVTLSLMPVLTQIIIMMVNGNLGTGIAIMGAFSLVRFRSIPGDAKQILGIFFAMSIGLATGMGYVSFAIIMTLIIGIILVVLNISPFGGIQENNGILRVTIPEDVDYTGVFDDLLKEFTKKWELSMIKSTNMGTMFELHYSVILKDNNKLKDLIDEIRTRNGNLTVIYTKAPDDGTAL